MKTGTIIAYGGGFDQGNGNFKKIVDKCMEKCGKNSPNMLFLPTAHKDILEEHEEAIAAFAEVGCKTDVLLVSKESAEDCKAKIENADIIYETGGNLGFLTTHWAEKGIYDLLKTAFARGVVMAGASSGAMCWAERGYDDCGEKSNWILTPDLPFIKRCKEFVFLPAANIIPFCICPHFDNPVWRKFKNRAKTLDIPSIALENGAAIIYENGNYEVMLERPNRKVYLFCPELNIYMHDVTKAPLLISIIENWRKTKRN